ncbi:hypothetical protein F4809DRAFT_618307 [Biscogniauxia mediterranea]|nr:hypothetical protein F4809DRAFT_618307 [Biscogniauxia mediterranea]
MHLSILHLLHLLHLCHVIMGFTRLGEPCFSAGSSSRDRGSDKNSGTSRKLLSPSRTPLRIWSIGELRAPREHTPRLNKSMHNNLPCFSMHLY